MTEQKGSFRPLFKNAPPRVASQLSPCHEKVSPDQPKPPRNVTRHVLQRLTYPLDPVIVVPGANVLILFRDSCKCFNFKIRRKKNERLGERK